MKELRQAIKDRLEKHCEVSQCWQVVGKRKKARILIERINELHWVLGELDRIEAGLPGEEGAA